MFLQLFIEILLDSWLSSVSIKYILYLIFTHLEYKEFLVFNPKINKTSSIIKLYLI
jgi:hypothetical protein